MIWAAAASFDCARGLLTVEELIPRGAKAIHRISKGEPMSRILRLQTVKDAKRLYGVDETAFDSTCSCSNNCGPC